MSRILEAHEAIGLAAYVPASTLDDGTFDDGGYSALHRPGSCEWQRPEALEARQRLAALGCRCAADPSAPWRVHWVAPLGAGAPAREATGERAAGGHPWELEVGAMGLLISDLLSAVERADRNGHQVPDRLRGAVDDVVRGWGALWPKLLPATPKATAGDPAGEVPSKPSPANRR